MFTQEFLQTILAYDKDTGEFTWKHRAPETFQGDRDRQIAAAKVFNGKLAGKSPKANSNGYYALGINGKVWRAHQIAWCWYHGEWPNRIDHIDGNGLNNAIANLRNITPRENSRNLSKPKNNSSGVIGVSYMPKKDKWQAYINGENGRIALGIFKTKDEAIAARRAAEIKHGYHENHGQRDALPR